MKKILVLLFTLLPFIAFSQDTGSLYSKAFGDSRKPAVIFLHGGPGYNCVGFELATAQKLADKGYYVIVFDQRGCGRSNKVSGKFTMDEDINDLKGIYAKYGVNTATLIGHSWGGTVSILFAEKNPAMVKNVVMVSSPLSYQMTLTAILYHCKDFYTRKNDTANLKYIAMLEKMDTASLQYSSYLFFHAMHCNLYRPKNSTEECKAIYQSILSNPDAKMMMQSDYPPVQGFYKNEHYTTLNLTKDIVTCKKEGVKFFGIYGSDDGLFDMRQLDELKAEIGNNNFTIVADASHNVFIDQRDIFLDTFAKYISNK